MYQYAYLKNVQLWHSFTLTRDKWHTTDLDLIWQGDSLQVGHLQCHLGFIQDVLWEHTFHTLNFQNGVGGNRAVLLYWYECLLVDLACQKPVCICCCEHEKGFVWKFFMQHILTFIHSFTFHYWFGGKKKVMVSMATWVYKCKCKRSHIYAH